MIILHSITVVCPRLLTVGDSVVLFFFSFFLFNFIRCPCNVLNLSVRLFVCASVTSSNAKLLMQYLKKLITNFAANWHQWSRGQRHETVNFGSRGHMKPTSRIGLEAWRRQAYLLGFSSLSRSSNSWQKFFQTADVTTFRARFSNTFSTTHAKFGFDT